MDEFLQITVGTAGHIDHGKSTLVKAVTGTDPDRLKEERERGMTIDLGYAEYTLPDGRFVGIVDVPGHERFIKNMVAGATGVDFVLLVVAADDGVMPQTREHLEIMELLGLRRGMVVLNKSDLVERDMLDLAEEDVRELLKGTFLAEAPLVRVSAATGDGIDEFRRVFEAEVLRLEPRPVEGVFRMPVQRVFVAEGFGAVVTGVPVSGRVGAGARVEIYPEGLAGRVRTIQVYKRTVNEAQAGHRTALNIAEVDYKRIRRGCTVAEPNSLAPTNHIETLYTHLASADKPLRSGTSIRLHTGTQEIMGHAFLLSASKVAPGERALVQFRLGRPAVCAVGDRFIVRLASPLRTLGGGLVVGLSGRRLRPGGGPVLSLLSTRAREIDDRRAVVDSIAAEAHLRGTSVAATARAMGLRPAEVEDAFATLVKDARLVRVGQRYYHTRALETLRSRVERALEAYHKRHPLRAFSDLRALSARLGVDEDVFELAVEASVKAGRIEREARRARIAGWRVELSAESARLASEIERAYKDAGLKAPNKQEVIDSVGGQLSRIEMVYGYLVESGVLVRLTETLLLHREAFEEARRRVVEQITESGRIDAQKAKSLFGLSRKYVIPLLEALDRRGVTRRVGDHRVLAGDGTRK